MDYQLLHSSDCERGEHGGEGRVEMSVQLIIKQGRPRNCGES